MLLPNTQTSLQDIITLADHGLFLQAQAFLPALLASEDVGAQLQAQRLYNHLGASRLATARLLQMWRKDKSDAQLLSAYARYLLAKRGPHAAWQFVQEQILPLNADDETSAEWLSTKARTYAYLRDFSRAQELSELARRAAPDNLWIHDEWAQICDLRDDQQEAIAVVREVLQRDSQFRASIQSLAKLYSATGQDEEALALLQVSANSMESGSVWGQLFELQFEHGMYPQASASLDAWQRCTPMSEKYSDVWLQARRTDIALRLGDYASAKAHAKLVKGPFFERLLSRLEQDSSIGKRVFLPVGFVRQHYMTCAPATLAALSQYWQRPAEHLEIAEEICYDGTSLYNERKWAQQQGFFAQEFTANWQVTRALLDAGVPFTLATVYTAAGHLQAVIGYDELRGTLLIRDPNARTHTEYDAESLFASHQSSGPRGMLLLPLEEKKRLEGIVLPDRAMWDARFAISRALDSHQRDDAQRIVTQMMEKVPRHWITITVQRSLALYDGDDAAVLANTEQLLALFPKDLNLQLGKAYSIGNLQGRSAQLAWLESVITANNTDGQALAYYASVLMSDDRQNPRTEKLLKQALRYAPMNGNAWFELAKWEMKHQRSSTATSCFRIASCLQETNEDFASSYFNSALREQQLAPALAYLQQRYESAAEKSSSPLITLFCELEMLERTEEGFELLKTALARKPNDPDLVLFAVDAFLRYGKKTAAKILMERAKFATKQAAWLHAQAKLEREIGDPKKALEFSLQASQKEPLNLPYQRLTAALFAQIEGSTRAINYLQEICLQFSHHLGLHQLLVAWMNDRPLDEVELVLHHLVHMHPNFLWAQRELALNLGGQQRFKEAHQIMQLVMEMAPNNDTNYAVHAGIYAAQGDLQNSCANFRKALLIYVDNPQVLGGWLENCASQEERQQALALARSELMRQVSNGDGLLSYQTAASSTEARKTTYDFLQDVLQQRPDLWQAWVALAIQCLEMGEHAQALQLLSEALQKFPLCPRLYLEMARVQSLQSDRTAALSTLQAALRISPQWLQAIRMQVNLMLEEGVDDEIPLQVLASALARMPESAELHCLRANIMLKQQQHSEALASLKTAIFLDASQGWPWQLLRRLASDMAEPQLLEQVAQQLTEKKPGEFWSWGRLANALTNVEEALQAIERAIKLAPRNPIPFEIKLSILLRNQYYEALQQALNNPPWQGFLPTSIRVYQVKCDWAMGKHAEAARAMRTLLDETPHDAVFWQEYAEYCSELNDLPQYLDATENMLRLDINSAQAHGFTADALSRLERFEEAQAHYERAFAIDPSYTFAGFALIDQALQERNAPRSKELIDILAQATASSLLQGRIVQYAALVNEPALASVAAKKILASEERYDWPTKIMLEVMEQAGWREQLIEQIKAAMQQGYCAQSALRYWITCLDKGTAAQTYAKVKALFAFDPQHLMKYALVSWLTANQHARELANFVNEFKASMQPILNLWVHVGYSLVELALFAQAAAWLADYPQRENVPIWILDTYALALRCLGQSRQAHDVSKESHTLDPANSDPRVWLAYDAALFNQQQQYQSYVQDIVEQDLSPPHIVLLDIVQTYQEAIQQRQPQRALQHYRAIQAEGNIHRAAELMIKELSKRLLAHSTWYEKPFLWAKYLRR